MSPNRLALFDCDGTLVDSQHSICACMDVAFGNAGLPPPGHEATRRIVGLSLAHALRVLAPQADAALHERLANDYRVAFGDLRSNGMTGEPLFPGIVDTLDALDKAGWVLGIATGASDRGLALRLTGHDLTSRFVTLQTADRHPSKPHPAMVKAAMIEAAASPETTIVIGDTSYDMIMARAAGTSALGVAWGYHDPAELKAAGAFAIAACGADIVTHAEARIS